ncbi:heterochromatin protein 1-like [Drosophila tropicalis]|uniref:heterochromatin protein 1-like n=1 Tax=Drosophila tropicalis TaxID=46794 RepID=UPI0035AC1F36
MSEMKDNNKSKDPGSQEFVIEKILDQRLRNDKVEYYIKWKSHCKSKNSWKELDPLAFANVIEQFQLKRIEKAPKKAASKASNSDGGNSLDGQTGMGNGFQRGLEALEICGVAYNNTGLMYLIRFEGGAEPELIPAKVAKTKIPQMVIQYYESRTTWESDGEKLKNLK